MGSLTPGVGDRDHAQGSPEAPVTLVEYADYECPFSGGVYGVIKSVQERFGDRLRFVYRNFPLSGIHPHARHAAEAAEAAGGQGAFWPMHVRLFEHQRQLDDAHLRRYAVDEGLDADRFAADLADHAFADRVDEDVASGEASGVPGTPTFFVNGVRYEMMPDYEHLVAAVEHALSERVKRRFRRM